MIDLELAGVHKSYGGQPVLRGLDLAVVAGIVHRDPRAVGQRQDDAAASDRRLRARRQRCRAARRRVVDDGEHYVAPDRRRIGFVPQDGSLFPHLSVEQNVGFGLPRRERRGRRVTELLEMVGLGGLERRYPHQLSGGQQQRVALARALAIAPSLVLLDEPFASLDASLRASAAPGRAPGAQARPGTTALLVTHDQDEALSLADRVAIIHDGRIGQCGSPQELYSHPASAELALGLGEANFLAWHGAAAVWSRRPSGCLLSRGLLLTTRVTPGDGTTLVVLVRPEQVVFSEPGDERRTACVLDAEFYGHDAVVRLRADRDGAIIVARTSEAASLPKAGARVGAFGSR